MSTRISTWITVCVVSVGLWPSVAVAQTPAAPPAPPPAPTGWQFLKEATLSLMAAQGNTEGHALDVQLKMTVKKERVTNESELDLSRRDLAFSDGGSAVYHDHTVKSDLGYDVAKKTRLVAGFEAYRNTLMLIDSRVSVHVGAGQSLFQGKTHSMNVRGGFGYSWVVFDGPGIEDKNPDALMGLDLTPRAPTVMVAEYYSLSLPSKVTLSQSVSFTDYFSTDLGQLWMFSVNLNVPVGKHFSFVPEYQLKHEDNEIVQALGVIPHDRTFTLGVKITF